MNEWEAYLPFCQSERQAQVISLRAQGMTAEKVSESIGIARRTILATCARVKANAAKQGYSPDHDMIHTVPDNFSVSGTSTLYKDGEPIMQWVKSKNDAIAMFEQALESFKEGLIEDVHGKARPVQKPTEDKDPNLLASYLIGDHHLGMVAWTPETGDDNYDIDISTKLLFNAVDTLTSMSSHAHTGILLNLGDMMHANNLKNQTGSQTHTLDVDGRMGKAIRAVGQMYKRLITRMLEAHNEVWVINVRGNHDPDSSLWLNEMVKMYYENEPRVHVFDNYNKFLHFRWGYNLVALHHGDKINVQRLYEKITSSLAKEWGESKYRFAWTGHIHHKQAHEIGGLHHESWNVLPPTDSYHSEHLYGASRSMTTVLLHKEFGEHSRFKVGIDQL
jgi:hypothetical protein